MSKRDDAIRTAYESGYCRGHNDTVESCYVDPSMAADDYLAALEKLAVEPSEDARELVDTIDDILVYDEDSVDYGEQLEKAVALITERDERIRAEALREAAERFRIEACPLVAVEEANKRYKSPESCEACNERLGDGYCSEVAAILAPKEAKDERTE